MANRSLDGHFIDRAAVTPLAKRADIDEVAPGFRDRRTAVSIDVGQSMDLDAYETRAARVCREALRWTVSAMEQGVSRASGSCPPSVDRRLRHGVVHCVQGDAAYLVASRLGQSRLSPAGVVRALGVVGDSLLGAAYLTRDLSGAAHADAELSDPAADALGVVASAGASASAAPVAGEGRLNCITMMGLHMERTRVFSGPALVADAVLYPDLRLPPKWLAMDCPLPSAGSGRRYWVPAINAVAGAAGDLHPTLKGIGYFVPAGGGAPSIYVREGLADAGFAAAGFVADAAGELSMLYTRPVAHAKPDPILEFGFPSITRMLVA